MHSNFGNIIRVFAPLAYLYIAANCKRSKFKLSVFCPLTHSLRDKCKRRDKEQHTFALASKPFSNLQRCKCLACTASHNKLAPVVLSEASFYSSECVKLMLPQLLFRLQHNLCSRFKPVPVNRTLAQAFQPNTHNWNDLIGYCCFCVFAPVLLSRVDKHTTNEMPC